MNGNWRDRKSYFSSGGVRLLKFSRVFQPVEGISCDVHGQREGEWDDSNRVRRYGCEVLALKGGNQRSSMEFLDGWVS
jgi:hypothetical protein